MLSADTGLELRKREANRSLRGLFTRFGICIERFARSLGYRSKTNVVRWVTEDSGECMPLAFVRKLPREAQIEVLREEAEVCGAAIVMLPAATPGARDMAALVRAHKETSDVLQALLAAFADGSADRAEAANVRMQIREAVAELLSLDLLMQEAEREGFVVLRKAVGT